MRKYKESTGTFRTPNPRNRRSFILGLGKRDPATVFRPMEGRIVALLGQSGLEPWESRFLQDMYRTHQQRGRVDHEQWERLGEIWARFPELKEFAADSDGGEVLNGLRNR